MGEKKSKPHATRSFEDMMASAQLKALQPFIQQQVLISGRENLMQLSQLLLQHLAEFRLRNFAIEAILKEKLGVTDEDIAEKVSSEEDKIFNYSEVTYGASQGDLVRFEITTTLGKDSKRQPLNGKVAIQALNSKNESGQVQTMSELEEALIGMTKGESKTLTLDSDAYHFTVKRVSKKL
jgi:hypothetical protein